MSSSPPLLECRRKTVARLKADLVVTALVDADQIFGEASSSAVWPFVRCSEFEGEGEIIGGNVHVFAKGKFSDAAHQITEEIGTCLDSAVLALDDGRAAHVRLIRTRMLSDPEEQSAWHGIAQIEIRVARDCAQP